MTKVHLELFLGLEFWKIYATNFLPHSPTHGNFQLKIIMASSTFDRFLDFKAFCFTKIDLSKMQVQRFPGDFNAL